MKIETTLSNGEAAVGFHNHIERRVDFALKSFKHDIQRIHVRFEGVNDLKGEVGVRCNVLFNFFSHGMIVVQGGGMDVFSAFNSCIKKIIAAINKKNEIY